jgi:hypothetical protein
MKEIVGQFAEKMLGDRVSGVKDNSNRLREAKPESQSHSTEQK